jgi:hypothetical protein
MFDELAKRLQIAKDAYQHVIDGIDGALKAAVSQDPAHLKAAGALQASYALKPTAVKLVKGLQPAAKKGVHAVSHTPTPPRVKKATKTTKATRATKGKTK